MKLLSIILLLFVYVGCVSTPLKSNQIASKAQECWDAGLSAIRVYNKRNQIIDIQCECHLLKEGE